MSKVSVSLIAAPLAGVLGYFAFNPDAAQSAVNWVRRQAGAHTPEMKPVGAPNYMPVTPGGF